MALKKTGAVLASIGLVLAGGLAGFALDKEAKPAKPIDTSQFATKTDLGVLSNQSVAIQADVSSVQDKILAEDAWEATAEVLALSELENRDYKELGRFILNDSQATRDDVDELDLSVEVRETDFSGMDDEDQDGQVTFDLRVRYEDSSGDRQKQFVTATATIEDGEVEDLTFA